METLEEQFEKFKKACKKRWACFTPDWESIKLWEEWKLKNKERRENEEVTPTF